MNSEHGRTGVRDAASNGLKVVVVDYGSGNLRSVARALEKAGVNPVISGDPRELATADAVVLPGVGAGDSAMKALNLRGLTPALQKSIAAGLPFLGVCLGLHLLMERTEEGNVACLGVVDGQVRRLPPGLKVPHMGWNMVETGEEHPVLRDMPRTGYFYFVHSYYVEPREEQPVLGVTEYGLPFCSILAVDNIIATQFHPEKSGPLGLKLYANFVRHAAREDK